MISSDQAGYNAVWDRRGHILGLVRVPEALVMTPRTHAGRAVSSSSELRSSAASSFQQ